MLILLMCCSMGKSYVINKKLSECTLQTSGIETNIQDISDDFSTISDAETEKGAVDKEDVERQECIAKPYNDITEEPKLIIA